jgi:hypothetical protein
MKKFINASVSFKSPENASVALTLKKSEQSKAWEQLSYFCYLKNIRPIVLRRATNFQLQVGYFLNGQFQVFAILPIFSPASWQQLQHKREKCFIAPRIVQIPVL